MNGTIPIKRFHVIRDAAGHATAIGDSSRDTAASGYVLVHLLTGTERNEENVQALADMLNEWWLAYEKQAIPRRYDNAKRY